MILEQDVFQLSAALRAQHEADAVRLGIMPPRSQRSPYRILCDELIWAQDLIYQCAAYAEQHGLVGATEQLKVLRRRVIEIQREILDPSKTVGSIEQPGL